MQFIVYHRGFNSDSMDLKPPLTVLIEYLPEGEFAVSNVRSVDRYNVAASKLVGISGIVGR